MVGGRLGHEHSGAGVCLGDGLAVARQLLEGESDVYGLAVTVLQVALVRSPGIVRPGGLDIVGGERFIASFACCGVDVSASDGDVRRVEGG